MEYFNPYSENDFVTFFVTFATRLFSFVTGKLSFFHLVADEIQLLVLIGVALSGALVGTFLVFRRMTMLANALSHTILIGIVAAFLISGFLAEGAVSELNMKAMLFASLLMGFITTFLTQFFVKVVHLQQEAATGLVFTTLFALGIILLTLFTRDAHIGSEVVMGNADALILDDCYFVYLNLLLNLLVFMLFFKEYKITTFDPALAKTFGISNHFFNYLLMGQTALTAISGFRAVGVIMVLAFITAPVLTAKLLTHRLKTLIYLACAIGISASFIGVALSRHFLTVYDLPLSTGGVTICVLASLYICAIVYISFTNYCFRNRLKNQRLKNI